MNKNMRVLSDNEISILQQHFQPLTFENAFQLVYEKQIPNTGVVLIAGEMELIKQKKVHEKIRPGFLLGVHHLVNNEPVKFGCKVKENSVVIMIQKSDIMEALNNRKSALHDIISEHGIKT